MRGFGVALAKHRVLIGPLQLEQPRLGIGIGVEIAIAVEMVGGDVEQRRDITGEAEGEIDLIARQFEHIDAAIGKGRLPQDRQADIAAHPCGNPCPAQQMMHQHGGGGFAIGAGDPHHAMRRQGGAGLREKLDIADQRHASRAGGIADWVSVYRDAGRYQNPGETGEIHAAGIGQLHRRTMTLGNGVARFLAGIPGGDSCSARHQRGHRRSPGAGEAQHGVALAREEGGDDHRSLRVERPSSANTMETIQKRITTVDSAQPFCSK